MCLSKRRFLDCIGRLAGAPFYALVGGSAAVTALGVIEANLCIQTSSKLPLRHRLRFIAYYSISQVIPSIVWNTQPPCTIAQSLNLNPNHFYKTPLDAPPLRTIRLTAIQSVRGALAGSIILSQVLSLMDVISLSRAATAERIRLGREPPLLDTSRHGVVVRLAGPDSPLTHLSMARDGRRHLFPIVENHPHEMIQQHGSPRWLATQRGWPEWFVPDETARDSKTMPQVPIYWHVEDGRYSHCSSWENLEIAQNWLLSRTTQSKPLLYLEADATSGTSRSMSLRRVQATELDLDLYEVAQGFRQLQRLVKSSVAFDTLRVLLVDAQVSLVSGGGRQTTAREYATELDLADIIIDARGPLLHVVVEFLKSVPRRKRNKIVVLETPRKEWFDSIKTELKRATGVNVVDRADAVRRFGSLEGLPVLIYENTTADTFHTTRQYIQRGMVQPEQVCALCPSPWSLEGLVDSRIPSVRYVSSADIYDRLLRWVRHQAIRGNSAADIQKRLDEGLSAILGEIL